MRYAILSDIHSNLEALEAALDFLTKQSIDQYLILGDIVGYGANPREVLAKIRELNPLIIAGNHDWAACGRYSTHEFNPNAQAAVVWTSQVLTSEEKDYLSSLPLTIEQEQFMGVHGDLLNPGEFGYVLDEEDARQNFCFLQKQICFIGHSHVPIIFFKNNKQIFSYKPQKFSFDSENKYFVNVGSLGQPRDRNPKVCCCVYDSDSAVLEYHRIEYDVDTAAKKIIQAGLPVFLGQRLFAGV